VGTEADALDQTAHAQPHAARGAGCGAALDRDVQALVHEPVLSWSMILSENRFPLFGIML
jgi:hypothetical protein